MGALKRDERGVSALEYVILAVIIVVAVAAAAPTVNKMYTDAFNATSNKVAEKTQ